MNSLPPPPMGSAPLPPPNATTADPLELTLNRKQTWLQRYWALPVVLALGVAAIAAVLIAVTTGDDNSATGTNPPGAAIGSSTTNDDVITSSTIIVVPTTTAVPVPETSTSAPVTTAPPATTLAPATTAAPPTTAVPIAPLQLVGKLKGIVDVSGHTPSMMTITCNGSKAFIITALDGNGRVVDVLIDKIGKYSGTVAVLDPSITSLQIESSGNWTIDVADLNSASHVSGPNSGTGDVVFVRDDSAGSARITHSGRGAFSVKTSTGAVVAEGTGAFDSTVAMPAGPVVLIVRADGAWSIA